MEWAEICFYTTIWGCKLLKVVIIDNETLFRTESNLLHAFLKKGKVQLVQLS